jgi:hypothetical protein
MDNVRQLVMARGVDSRIADGLERLYVLLGRDVGRGQECAKDLARRELVFARLLDALDSGGDTGRLVLRDLTYWRGIDPGTLLATVFNAITPPELGHARLAPDSSGDLFATWRELHDWKRLHCRKVNALSS